MSLKETHASTARFFRAYEAFLADQERDTFFHWLEAMHSLSDRLKTGHGVDLLGFEEFLALKCLRNYFHHHAEVKHKIKFLQCDGATLISDLVVLCLLPLAQVQAALAEESRFREQVQTAMATAFRQYGQVVNVNPAVFNLVARTALLLGEHDLEPDDCPPYRQLKDSIDFERQNGHSHFVDGEIQCHAGSVELVLEQLMTMDE